VVQSSNPGWLGERNMSNGLRSFVRRRGARILWLASASFAAVLASHDLALALSPDEAREEAESLLQAVEADTARVTRASKVGTPKSAEERLAIGELLARNKDNEAAIFYLNQVIELFEQGKANEATHADALFLLGETYVATGQLASARRQFRNLVQLGDKDAYAGYAGPALSRLVDVAMRRDFKDELDFVFESLTRFERAKDPLFALQYARGKAQLAAGHLPEAIAELGRVPEDTNLGFQAQYLLGVAFTQQAVGPKPPQLSKEETDQVPALAERFARAVLQFQKLTRLAPKSAEQQHVVDLAWMALGRIFYESGNALDAAEAYTHVRQDSPELPTMLLELAWVYIQLEDNEQAQQTLELLEAVAPESLGLAEGALLRADLHLRSRQFDEALQAYTSVRARFGGAYRQLERFIKQHRDPAVYYDRLIEHRAAVRMEGDLPPVVMEWVREVEDVRALALIDDVGRSRKLVKDSRVLARTMTGVLSAATRARAFPELRVKMQAVLGATNKLMRAKQALAAGLVATDPGPLSGSAAQLRRQRSDLGPKVAALPVEVRDFLTRESTASRQWDKTSQKLRELTLETDQMLAILNGLRRLATNPEEFGLQMSRAELDELSRNVVESERDIAVYKQRIAEQQEAVDRGRVQVGFGDQSYDEDEKLRARFVDLVRKEFGSALQGQQGEDAQRYASEVRGLLNRMDKAQARLNALSAGYEREVAERTESVSAQVDAEARNVEDGALRLDVLDQHARQLFGEIARRSFVQVKEKLGNILLRADVGVAQEAWEVRQTHLDRVRDLQRLKTAREKDLNEELKEVLQDGSGL
jgi:tetratricopeptide (TPR) repeat protein